jgi:hypothetical protein
MNHGHYMSAIIWKLIQAMNTRMQIESTAKKLTVAILHSKFVNIFCPFQLSAFHFPVPTTRHLNKQLKMNSLQEKEQPQ